MVAHGAEPLLQFGELHKQAGRDSVVETGPQEFAGVAEPLDTDAEGMESRDVAEVFGGRPAVAGGDRQQQRRPLGGEGGLRGGVAPADPLENLPHPAFDAAAELPVCRVLQLSESAAAFGLQVFESGGERDSVITFGESFVKDVKISDAPCGAAELAEPLAEPSCASPGEQRPERAEGGVAAADGHAQFVNGVGIALFRAGAVRDEADDLVQTLREDVMRNLSDRRCAIRRGGGRSGRRSRGAVRGRNVGHVRTTKATSGGRQRSETVGLSGEQPEPVQLDGVDHDAVAAVGADQFGQSCDGMRGPLPTGAGQGVLQEFLGIDISRIVGGGVPIRRCHRNRHTMEIRSLRGRELPVVP